ncbi:MAG TPA: hypothetical protein VLK65_29485 [Vicinamibacteria bacterium]|nr:hypothetical protein [Vicinamibacteria bacterium]
MSRARVELDPALVEEAVLLAIEAEGPERRYRYRRERDPIYEIEDLEDRERRFRNLDAQWFAALHLGQPMSSLLRESEAILASVSKCLVLKAVRKKEEGADLYESRSSFASEHRPALVLKLTPRSLLDFARVELFFRRELLHVEDMLDPSFGYVRDLTGIEGGASYENLLKSRYRVLWDTTVDGRLEARGKLPPEEKARRQREFTETFVALGSEAASCFDKLFHGPRPRHPELLAFAVTPGGRESPSGRCPLCGFPTTAFFAHPERLEARVVTTIQNEFPEWRPAEGICLQCADLYLSRASGKNTVFVSNECSMPWQAP